jgi:hypothetical protein
MMHNSVIWDIRVPPPRPHFGGGITPMVREYSGGGPPRVAVLCVTSLQKYFSKE